MGRGGYASLAEAALINSFGQDFLGGAAAGEKMRQVVGDIQINDRLKQIGDAVTQAGGSIDGIDPTLFSDPVGLRALGEYTTQYNSSQEGLQKAWKNHDQAIMRMFETTTYAPQAFKQSGDPSILDQASDKLGLPYQTQYNPETKRHEVMYAGRFGPEATGQSFTSEELSNLYGGLAKDPKRFSQLAFQYSLATMRQNEDYLKDPSKWLYDNDGKTVFVPRKMMTANGFRSGYIVTDTANKTSKFMTNEELQQAGVFPKDLQTMKGLFDMEKGRADMANDKVRLGYEGQRVLQGWAEHNLNLERFKYEKGDELIPGMPGINRKGLKKTMDADFNQWMAASGYTEKNGVFYKPEYNKDGSIVVDAQENPKLKAMSPAEVGEARAEHQQDFVKRYTGQSAPGQGGDVGNIILSRGLEYKGGKPSVPPAGNGGNIPSQGKTSTEQPARLGGGMVSESEKKVAMLGGLLAHGIPGETDEEMLGGPPRINKRIPQKTPAETKEHMLSRLHSKGIPGETDIELARSKQNTSASLNWYDRYRQFTQSQWAPTQLSGTEEAAFKEWLIKSRWFREIKDNIERHEGKVDDNRLFAELTGPHADYDYRGAWKADVGAQDYKYDDRMHWPSSTGDGRILKSPKHSTAWMEFFMEEYGIDPNSLGLHSAEAALEYVRKAKLVPR